MRSATIKNNNAQFEEMSKSSVFPYIMMVAGSLLIPLLIFVSKGNIALGGVFVIVVGVTLLTFYRLDWGVLLWFALVMISDNYEIPGFHPITYSLSYLLTLNAIVPGLGIGVLAPIEVHILFIFFVFIILVAFRKITHWHSIPLAYPASMFFGWLVVSLVYGKFLGGDMQMGIWEIRALIFFGITFFFIRQIITTKEQVRNLIWICIITISIKAFQAVDRFIFLGINFSGFRALANHEDPVFMITLLILLFGLMLFKGDKRQKQVLLWIVPIILLGFYVANRRAAYAAFGICSVVFALVISASDRKKIMKIVIIFLAFFSLYVTAYWDSYGRLAVVAQAVKSTVFSHDKEMTRGSDYSSGLARDHENYNLAVTFRKSPVMGIGFGNKHEWAIQVYGDYALKGYITHNQILWLLTTTGSIGFFLFLFFLNLICMHGGFVFSKLSDPYLKAVCLMCILAVINQLVVSYVDMQLTFYRNMVYLGTLTGLIATLGDIDRLQSPVPMRSKKLKNL